MSGNVGWIRSGWLVGVKMYRRGLSHDLTTLRRREASLWFASGARIRPLLSYTTGIDIVSAKRGIGGPRN
jgi:hypothetical protein